MIAWIDNLLNRITMYRLVLYYLCVLVGAAFVASVFSLLPFTPFELIISTLVILTACWFTNLAFAAAFEVPANVESVYITALILALIISPIKLDPFDLAGLGFLIWAGILAMASKYMLVVNRKHIFNPAAIAVAITGLALGEYASWWVCGNVALMAFVVIGGLLVVRKIQRFDLVITFCVVAVASIVLSSPGFDPLATAEKGIVHTSLLFFAFIMLTEPLTTPPTRGLRIAYGALVGALFSPALHVTLPWVGAISSTPELALVTGNLFSYVVSPKRKYLLALQSKEKVGADTYDFTFRSVDDAGAGAGERGKNNVAAQPVRFQPGQYMEWTLGRAGADNRGNRRYFTIASSPTEPDIHLGVKFYPDAGNGNNAGKTIMSTFKQKMLALETGDRIMGGSPTGDFTLPHDASRKLVFIAGGIGITPFRSMLKYLSDRGEKRDAILLYSNRSATEIAYSEIFNEARRTIGLKTIYVITDESPDPSSPPVCPGHALCRGRIDDALIRREIPDYHDRIFYLSGPRGMVTGFQEILRGLGVPRTHIKTDFFPGFA